MDIEFHYYIGAITAAAAGFSHDDAIRIAASAQQIDDNRGRFIIYDSNFLRYASSLYNDSVLLTHHDIQDDIKKLQFEIDSNIKTLTPHIHDAWLRKYHARNKSASSLKQSLRPYISCMTQNYDAAIRLISSIDTYIAYHFIPGDARSARNARIDGMHNSFTVTPGGRVATLALRHALQQNNHYQIGIASHAYADTWAHQNFTGIREGYNITSSLIRALPENITKYCKPIGHVDAMHKPDRIDCVWRDHRLKRSVVHNNNRFINAARSLYIEYRTNNIANAVCDDREWGKVISNIIYEKSKKKRLNMYRDVMREITGYRLPLYSSDRWRKDSIILVDNVKQIYGANVMSDDQNDTVGHYERRGSMYDNIMDGYYDLRKEIALSWCMHRMVENFDGFAAKIGVWRTAEYKQSDWYLFQEAAKTHQDVVWRYLKRRGM